MNEIKHFNKSLVRAYPKNEELLDRIVSLIHEYDGEMSTAAAIGILDLAKDYIKADVLDKDAI